MTDSAWTVHRNAPSRSAPRWIPSARVDEFAEALLEEWLARSKSAVRITDRDKALEYARARVLAILRQQGVEVLADA